MSSTYFLVKFLIHLVRFGQLLRKKVIRKFSISGADFTKQCFPRYMKLTSLRTEHLSDSGLSDFSWYNIPKRQKIFQMTTNYTNMAVKYIKWHLNIPYGNKYRYLPTLPIPRPSKIYPNWDFWYEYM
jgi:hypothetical protein